MLAALAWAFAITGFALYLASFGTFEDTYGTIGSGIVLLVWLTMFSMLYYVTPDLRVAGIARSGAGAALSAVTWLLVNAVAGRVHRELRRRSATPVAAVLTAAVFVGGLWVSNVVVLLGVRLNALGRSPGDGRGGRRRRRASADAACAIATRICRAPSAARCGTTSRTTAC